MSVITDCMNLVFKDDVIGVSSPREWWEEYKDIGPRQEGYTVDVIYKYSGKQTLYFGIDYKFGLISASIAEKRARNFYLKMCEKVDKYNKRHKKCLNPESVSDCYIDGDTVCLVVTYDGIGDVCKLNASDVGVFDGGVGSRILEGIAYQGKTVITYQFYKVLFCNSLYMRAHKFKAQIEEKIKKRKQTIEKCNMAHVI